MRVDGEDNASDKPQIIMTKFLFEQNVLQTES